MGSLNGLSVEEKEKVKEILSKQWLKCNKQIEIIEKEVGIRISRYSLFYYRKKFRAFRKCKTCDMEINDATSNRNMHGRYCSTICRLNDRVMECKQCKNLFEPPSGRSKNDWLFRNIVYFCSKNCRREYLKEHKEIKMKICSICNIKFKLVPYHYQKYCSEKCKIKALKERAKIRSENYYRKVWTSGKIEELKRLYNEENIKAIDTLSKRIGIGWNLTKRKLVELGLKVERKFRVLDSLNSEEEEKIKELLLNNIKLCYRKQIEIIGNNVKGFKPSIVTFGRLRQKLLGSDRCKVCGSVILNRSGGEKYCSNECKLADKGKKCLECGKIFLGYTTKFCSRRCYNNYRKKDIEKISNDIIIEYKENGKMKVFTSIKMFVN